jgi:hypothetical protein
MWRQLGFYKSLQLITLSLIALYGVYGLRAYGGNIFAVSTLVGCLVAAIFTAKKQHHAVLAAVVGLFFISILFSIEHFLPDISAKLLSDIEANRRAFLNVGRDDFARSAFAVNYSFAKVSDLLFFLMTSLTYYFYAPFFWQVNSSMQAFSQIEVFAVMLLTYPTIKGIIYAHKRNVFVTVFIVTFVLLIAAGQSIVISNMGTIFRHRAIVFILLSIFTGIGIEEMIRSYFARRRFSGPVDHQSKSQQPLG